MPHLGTRILGIHTTNGDYVLFFTATPLVNTQLQPNTPATLILDPKTTTIAIVFSNLRCKYVHLIKQANSHVNDRIIFDLYLN